MEIPCCGCEPTRARSCRRPRRRPAPGAAAARVRHLPAHGAVAIPHHRTAVYTLSPTHSTAPTLTDAVRQPSAQHLSRLMLLRNGMCVVLVNGIEAFHKSKLGFTCVTVQTSVGTHHGTKATCCGMAQVTYEDANAIASNWYNLYAANMDCPAPLWP